MGRKSQKAGSPAYRFHGSSGLLSGKSLDVVKMPLTKFETDYSKQLLSTTGGGVKKRLKKSLKKKRKPSKKRKSKKVEEAGCGSSDFIRSKLAQKAYYTNFLGKVSNKGPKKIMIGRF